MFRRSALEMRAVILAPIGRDATLLSNSLSALQVDTAIAADAEALVSLLTEGVGCAIIGEEALAPTGLEALKLWLAAQPPWSDTPFIVLTFSGRATRQSHDRAAELQELGNVTFIERPVRPDTVFSSVRSALRARMRQYEVRSRQEALIQANADLEQFAHSASHDLREPLRSISIYSELLVRNYVGVLDEKGVEFLNLIRSRALRMDALLDDLLAYAHASSIPEGTVEPVDAARPLQWALDNLTGAIQQSGAKITIGQMPAAKMRESHLSQLFQNLIGNAIKYRKPDRPVQIQLSASRANGSWVFTISDNGIGVPPAYKETIFGIFKRLHSHSEYSGTGMGLAICKRIVERYRGRIWVESELERGADFFFSVPD
jgi:signal transduction histidine kinase